MKLKTLSLAAATLLTAAAGCVPVARGAAPATGGGHPVLVELFTSQGCSSCPAAEAFLRQLPQLGLDRSKVVPLAFHVDYWDGLGWPDPFAAPAFTARQQRYADAGGLRAPAGEDGITGLYTPQMIVDGAVHFSGRLRRLALAEIERARSQPAPLDLAADLTLDADRARVKVRLAALQPAAAGQRWMVFVAVAAKQARTQVARGENAGETLEEAATVRALSEPITVALPQARPIEISVPRPAGLAWPAAEIVVVAQSQSTLHVGAARLLR